MELLRSEVPNIMFRNNALLILIPLSIVSILFFAGLYSYAGTIYPSTKYASPAGEILMWGMWGILIILPISTVVIFVLKYRDKK